ncbi:family 2 glycosyl transferase [Chondrocystis sp. NIES-4102]|nr:family 2 glycosyl transferase [Chondrocystis sp. NIES-4102]
MNPLVSILIPCFNGEHWIEQAIKCALKQTYDHIEIIVLDDGSSDNSLEIVKSFGKHISWYTSTHRGLNYTRNHLLDLSRGEWLQYLDADNYLLPNKITKQTRFVLENPDTDLVYSPSILQAYNYLVEAALKNREDQAIINAHQTLNLDSPNTITQEVLPIPQPHDPWILLARWYLPPIASCLLRKQAIIDVGGWKEEQSYCQEYELYLRLLKANKQFNYCNEAGLIERQNNQLQIEQGKTYQQQLEIIDNLEQYLLNTNQLNQIRQTAINQARFEFARMIWLINKQWSKNIINQIHQTQNSFIPSNNCVSKIYRLMYQTLGFNLAENLAHFKRPLVVN